MQKVEPADSSTTFVGAAFPAANSSSVSTPDFLSASSFAKSSAVLIVSPTYQGVMFRRVECRLRQSGSLSTEPGSVA